jgi:hypothetical protein
MAHGVDRAHTLISAFQNGNKVEASHVRAEHGTHRPKGYCYKKEVIKVAD